MAHRKSKFKNVSLSTLFFFFSVLSHGVYSQVNEHEYMLMLLNALTPPPSGWSNKTDRCQWSGVHCDNWDYVDAIDLHSRSLTGTLPSGLNSLSQLTRLDLHNNSLSGPLPSLANLTFLQHLDLSSNNFTSIPDGCFQGLISLQDLTMSSNINLAPWMFPTDLTDSLILKRLNLTTTNLMGSLPDIFHQYFPKLENVLLSHNNITGVLPNSFAQSKVAVLWLNDQVAYNKLSGTIEILSSMTNLVKVELQGNSFEGPIPDLSNCTNLEELQLEDNRLTGVVPPSLMSLPWLTGVYLDNNFLQGPVPLVPKLNTHGTVEVSLGVNTTDGFCLDHAGPCDPRVTTLLEIAAAFGYPYLLARSWRGNNPCQHWRFIVCAEGKIRTVNLTKLNLTGTISPAFGNLTYLWNLYLGDNNLKGSIPKSLATLPQLKVVDVSNNNLSGNIPRFPSAVRFIATGNVLLGLPQNSRHRTSPSASKTSLSPPRIAGISIAGAGVIVIFVVVIYNCKRCLSLILKMFKKTTSTDHNVEDLIKTYGCLAPKRYSYSKVKKMTNSFCEKLGQGGYGTIYKASLTDGRQAAVKVLSESKGSGEEFINEVSSISRTSHVNIVSLLGFCYEMNGRALIYEFMPNGSLDKFIYEKGSPNAICNLDWNTLYKIAIGIA